MKKPTRNRSLHLASLASLTAVIGLTSNLSAQTWVPTAFGTAYDWNVDGNWTGAFPNAAGATANVNNDIVGNQTIRLQQAITVGTLNIGDPNNSNSFSISEGVPAGVLTFQSAVAGGATSLNISATQTTTISAGISLGGTSPLTVNTGQSGVVNLNGLISTNGNNITFTGGVANNSQYTVNGDITGSGRITNNGLSSVSFSGTKTFAGTLVANKGTGTDANAGSFTLTNGSLSSAAEFVINGHLSGTGVDQNGGSIVAGNNSGFAVNPGQRFTSNRITLNGGTLRDNGQRLVPDQPAEIIQDTVANFDFNSGYSLVQVGASTSTGGTRLIATTLERSAGATGYVRSSTLGGTARFIADNAGSFMVGGGGAEGTTTMSIIPWMVATNTNVSASTSGNFATSTATGIRGLNTGEYAVLITAGATANVATSGVGIASATTVNSLAKTNSAVDNIGAGQILTIASVLVWK